MPKSVPEIAKRLSDSHWNVRRQAAEDLKAFGASSALVIPEISKNLEETNWRVRASAGELLGGLSTSTNWRKQWKRPGAKTKAAIPEITLRLSDTNLGIRRTARTTLEMLNTVGSFGDLRDLTRPAVPPIIRKLSFEDWASRESAALLLGDLGCSAVPAVSELGRRLADESYRVRRAAKMSLEKLFDNRAILDYGALGLLAVPHLTQRLQEKDWRVRAAAAWGLGFLGGAAVVNVPQLVKEMQHEDWGVRYIAAESLGNLGCVAMAGVPELATLLEDSEPKVKDAARVALRKIQVSITRDPALVSPDLERLIVNMADGDINVREEATKALVGLGVLATPGIPMLIEVLLTDKRLDVRVSIEKLFANFQTVGSLGSVDAEAAETPMVRTLCSRLRDANWASRLAAAEAIAHLVTVAARVFIPLQEHEENDDPDSRALSFGARQIRRRLQKRGTILDIEDLVGKIDYLLLQAAFDYPDADIRNTAKDTLKRLEFVGFEFDLDEDGSEEGSAKNPSSEGDGSSPSSGGSRTAPVGLLSPVRTVVRVRSMPARRMLDEDPCKHLPPEQRHWRGGFYLPPVDGMDHVYCQHCDERHT